MSTPRLTSNAPPLLAPLIHTVISPANIELETRRRRADKLGLVRRWVFGRRARKLRRELARAGYFELMAVRLSIKADVEAIRDEQDQIREAYHDHRLPVDVRALAAVVVCLPFPVQRGLVEQWRAWRALLKQWADLNRQLEPMRAQAVALADLQRALEDHALAVAYAREERYQFGQLKREALIYEQLIVDRWTRLGFRSETTKKVQRVAFNRAFYGLDAIYFEIDAGYKTRFGKWRTNIPDGVYIARQLLAPETLDELTITCRRQVIGEWSESGAWVVVYRLESADGLMNYVTYDEAMKYYPRDLHDLFPVCAGVGRNRRVEWLTLADFPHWLIGGYTQSGKSNFINTVICNLITMHSPEDVRLALVDLKGGLEFSYYEGIPHLHGAIIDSVERVAQTLQDMEAIMRDRFRKFRGVAKTLEGYNAARPDRKMPRLICVFDEVASIMDNGGTTKEILSSLRELCRMGRAVGIHVLLCTQRPDVNAIDGSIKANLAVRISGRMVTSSDSVTILGNGAAKDLAAIPGRMVMQISAEPTPIQTPHITDAMLDRALNKAMTYDKPDALLIPADSGKVIERWTPERIIDLSIKHLGGNITYKRIYDAAEGLSQTQARELVESVWAMDEIYHEGKRYKVERGNGWIRRLVEIA